MAHENGHGMGAGRMMTGFLAGAAVGAGIALLLAPNSGVETKRRIGDFTQRMKTRIGDGAAGARGRFRDMQDDMKAAVDAGRETYRRQREARHEEDISKPTV